MSEYNKRLDYEGAPTVIIVDDRISAKLIGRYMLEPKPRINKPYYRQFEKPLRGRKQCNK